MLAQSGAEIQRRCQSVVYSVENTIIFNECKKKKKYLRKQIPGIMLMPKFCSMRNKAYEEKLMQSNLHQPRHAELNH